MNIISLFICKLTRFLLRATGRGGTSLPGKIALRISPNLLGFLARNVRTIVITGTNGKTTSSRIVEQAFIDKSISYFSNKAGANLITGITTEFATNATIFGKPKKQFAVIECDEAATKTVLKYLKPEVVLVTNIFRDQLDRFGEVTHTLNNIKTGLSHVKNATLCLNADCSLTSSLAEGHEGKVVFYGVDTPIYKIRVPEMSDAPYCIHCKFEYSYDYITYGHLGSFSCPNCGYARPETDVSVSEILSMTADDSSIKFDIFGKEYQSTINLPGGFNIYNAVGASTALLSLDFDEETVLNALKSFSCGFGRMEKFEINEHLLRMILVKNPAGCNQVLNFLTNLDGNSAFVICLNDNYADGTDISWIWDVYFDVLTDMGDKLTHVFVSGVRADDMALRLSYTDLPEEKISVFYDYDKLIDAMIEINEPVFIMPTYTAMLDLRQKLSTRFGFKNFWE